MKRLNILEELGAGCQEGRLVDSGKLKVESGKLNVYKSDKCISKNSKINILPKQHNVKGLSDLSDLSYLSDFKKKVAFTLAEVLITLAVVGVVSAMTIPTVINKYQEHVTVTKVKKFYSMMNQAFMLSVKDNGYANEWNVGNDVTSKTASQLTAYIKPYLKVIKDCGTNSGCLGYKEEVNLLNGKKHTINYDTRKAYYKLILSDGTYLFIRATDNVAYCQGAEGGHTNVCGAVFMDINGGKQPNTIGKDIFVFIITPFAVKPNIGDNCAKNDTGWGCSGYILKNGNMDYLK